MGSVPNKYQLEKGKIVPIIRQALREDIGLGDITSDILFSKEDKVSAVIISKQEGVLAGQEVSELVFDLIDSTVHYKPNMHDKESLTVGKVVAYIDGPVKSILKAERLALNFLSRLSGIATSANRFVKVLSEYNVKLRDTRKTTPGLRYLEKYAVQVGGGVSHRMGLYDGILIKDNHIVAFSKLAKDISKDLITHIISLTKKKKLKNTRIEIEVSNLYQLKEALKTGVEIVMLDNMRVEEIEEAVTLRNAEGYKTLIEVSGNITLENLERIAKTKPDFISVGAITHSALPVDMSLEVI